MKGLRRNGTERGFTLVELLVVVTILGILVAVVGVNVLRHPDRARRTAAKAQISFLVQAIEEFNIDTGTFPSTDEGLKVLIERPTDTATAELWGGPYLKDSKLPKDPWGHDYVYRQPGADGSDFDIICYGKDGVEGGEALNKDITNHNLDEK